MDFSDSRDIKIDMFDGPLRASEPENNAAKIRMLIHKDL